MTELCLQARALPYKARVVHYYVMNVNSRIRIRLGLQGVSCVEIWSADLRQIRELDGIESNTLWLLSKKVKSILFLLSLNSQFCIFYA